MIIRELKDIKSYVSLAEPHLGVFASQKWLEIYGSKLTVMGIFRDEKQMIGGFYYLKTKKFGRDFIKLPPYTPHCGLYFQNESKNASSRSSFSKEVMDQISEHFKTIKSDLCILAFPHRYNDFQSFIWKGFKVIPNYTYQIDLTRELEAIRADFDSKNRNAISKARKDGVEVLVNALPASEVFEFFRNSLTDAGANIYEHELKGVFTTFSDTSNSFTLQAKTGDNLIGMVHCVFDKNVCYYLLGGVNKNSGVQGVNNLLVARAIEIAKENGCIIFDFEGSMLPGVEKFFRGFGPQLIPYYTVNKANILLEMALKFYKRSVF